MSYLIKKDHKTNTITYMEYELEGYKFKPRNNTKIKINQITIINPDMIDKILTIKFSQMFKKLTSFVMQILCDNTDSDDSNTMYALAEIDRLKSIIINKYNKIAREKQQFFLAQLVSLENQLKMKKMISMQFDNMLYDQEEENYNRGR